MTYSQLRDIIDAMSDTQKAMAVVVATEGGYCETEAISELSFVSNEDFYPVGQVIILT